MTAGSPASGSSRIPFHKGLDGIRGLTMLIVFTYHAEPEPFLGGGHLSVPTFFTLSGFLITALLISEYDHSFRINLKAFWARRLRRLLPASWLILLLVAGPFAWWIAEPHQLVQIPKDIIASLFQVVNWHFIADGRSYFESLSRPSPVNHFWTLAIEEQFYLLYPLFMIVVYRGRNRRMRLAVTLIILALISIGLSTFVFEGDRRYFGTDTRAVHILFGAILATALRSPDAFASIRAQRIANAVGAVSFAGMIWAWLAWDNPARVAGGGGWQAYDLLSVGLIVAAINPGPMSKLLSVRPLAYFGAISYSVYLIHFPIIQIFDRDILPFNPLIRFVIQVAITTALAALSSRIFEQPIRYRRRLTSRAALRIVPTAGFALIITLALSASTIRPARLQAVEEGKTTFGTDREQSKAPVLALGVSSADAVALDPAKYEVQVPSLSPCGYARSGAVDAEPFDKSAEFTRVTKCTEWWNGIAAIIQERPPAVVLAYPFKRDRLPRTLPERTLEDLNTADLQQWLAAELSAAHDLLSERGADLIWITAASDATSASIDPFIAAYNAVLEQRTASGDVVVNSEDLESAIAALKRGQLRSPELQVAEPVDPATIPGAPTIDPVPIGGNVRVALFGDSVAFGLAYGLENWQDANGGLNVANWGRFHCPIARGGKIRFQGAEEPFAEECDWGTSVSGAVTATNPHVVLVMNGAWDITDRLLPGDTKWRFPGDRVFDNYFIQELTALVDQLGARGARVVLMTHHHVEIGRNLSFENLPESDPARVDRINEMYRLVAASRPGFVSVLEFGQWMAGLPRGETSTVYLTDGLHLRDEFVFEISQWLAPAVISVANAQPVEIPDPATQRDPQTLSD